MAKLIRCLGCFFLVIIAANLLFSSRSISSEIRVYSRSGYEIGTIQSQSEGRLHIPLSAMVAAAPRIRSLLRSGTAFSFKNGEPLDYVSHTRPLALVPSADKCTIVTIHDARNLKRIRLLIVYGGQTPTVQFFAIYGRLSSGTDLLNKTIRGSVSAAGTCKFVFPRNCGSPSAARSASRENGTSGNSVSRGVGGVFRNDEDGYLASRSGGSSSEHCNLVNGSRVADYLENVAEKTMRAILPTRSLRSVYVKSKPPGSWIRVKGKTLNVRTNVGPISLYERDIVTVEVFLGNKHCNHQIIERNDQPDGSIVLTCQF